MPKNEKLLYYDGESGSLKEIPRFKLKGALVLFTALIIGLSTLLVVNHVYYNFLNLGYPKATILENENRRLKEQLKSFSTQLENIEKNLEELGIRDGELRLLVDLPVIDSDTRRAGVGGAELNVGFGIVEGSARRVLNETYHRLERLQREVQIQKESFREIEDKIGFNETFFRHLPAIKPANGRYNLNSFGRRRHPVLGVMHFHEGIDIVCDVGTPVHATADGVVEIAGRFNGGYGRVVVINHGYGYKTLYAHLSPTIYVKRGQRVKRGDVIALSGRSGLVTGPHLHYEVIYNGVKKNPVDYFFDDIDYLKYTTAIAAGN